MSEYKTQEYPQKSLDELREFMAKSIPSTKILLQCYIEHGHGAKGKKMWLDSDLKAMYNLWCYTEKISSRGKKRARSPSGDACEKGGNYVTHSTKTMAAVDDIRSC